MRNEVVTLEEGHTLAMQRWVCELSVMMQSVLMSGVRGPDGLRKDHAAKVFMRWYRRCILISAFDRCVLGHPRTPGGGSFTGPLPVVRSSEFSGEDCSELGLDRRALDQAKDAIFRSIDELPHHFWLHLVHCAEILGYKHPHERIRTYWLDFYERACTDMHMYPETEAQMDARLGDTEEGWRAREATPAR